MVVHNRKERGASKLTLLIFGTLLAAVIYLGYRILPIYYAYYDFQNQMTAVAKKGQVLSNEEIRGRLAKDMKRLQIPADAEDINIVRGATEMEISLSYIEILSIWYGEKEIELHTFKFVAFAKEAFVGKSNQRQDPGR